MYLCENVCCCCCVSSSCCSVSFVVRLWNNSPVQCCHLVDKRITTKTFKAHVRAECTEYVENLNKLCTYPIVCIQTNKYFVVFKYTLDMCYTTDNQLSVSVPRAALLMERLQYFDCWALLALCWHSGLRWQPVFWLAGLGDGQRGLLFYCTPVFHPNISPFFLTSLLICEEWELCSIPDEPGSHVASPCVALPPCEGSFLCWTRIFDF